MFNPKELVRVDRANTRSGGVDYDLAYSPKTTKFRVSPELFDSLDITNNGFTLLEDAKNNDLYLAVEPNETAVMHRGRDGAKKGREFTASRFRIKLDTYGFKGVNSFNLDFVEEVEGISYYKITSTETGETRKPDDDVPVGHVPDPTPAQEPENEAVTSSDSEGDQEDDFGDVGSSEAESEDEDVPDHDDLDSLLD